MKGSSALVVGLAMLVVTIAAGVLTITVLAFLAGPIFGLVTLWAFVMVGALVYGAIKT